MQLEGNDFFRSADLATQKKVEFVMKYFGIYFRIIKSVRYDSYGRERKIVYIDPFSGPGVFEDNFKSVPIKLLEFIEKQDISNIKLIFNDIRYSDDLRRNIESLTTFSVDDSFITVMSKDANLINFSNMFSSDDIVLSYVDPFSYTRVDPRTIKELTANHLSDAIFFLNIQYFFRFIGIDKDNLIDFFGSENIYNKVKESIDNDDRSTATNVLIREYANYLVSGNSNRFILPIFFKKSHKDTKIFNAIFLVSKCITGLNSIKDYISGEDHFFIEDGNFVIYESEYSQLEEFNLFESKEDIILSFIPENQFINVNTLIERIDKKYLDEYGYISAYNQKYVKDALHNLEEENKLEINYTGNRKRSQRNGKNTYGPSTSFKRKENNI